MCPPYLEIFRLLLHQLLHMHHWFPSRPIPQGCYHNSLHPVSCPQALPPPTPSLSDHAFLGADSLGSFHNIASHVRKGHFFGILNLEGPHFSLSVSNTILSHLLLGVSNIGQLWVHDN